MKFILFIFYILILFNSSLFGQEKQNITKDLIYGDSSLSFVVKTKSGLVLREEPNQKSKKLALIPFLGSGLILGQTKNKDKIKDKEGYWYEVNYRNSRGFIFSIYVDTYENEDSRNTIPEDNNTHFLLLTKKPSYLDKPNGKKIENVDEYPNVGEFLEIDKGANAGKKYFLHFNMNHLYSDDSIQGWISSKYGILFTKNQFVNYTLKHTRINDKQKQILKVILNSHTDSERYSEPVNFIETSFIPVQVGRQKNKKEIYILHLVYGIKTKQMYGKGYENNLIVWKEEKNYNSKILNSEGKIKTLDIDKDGIPEIYVEFENRGEASFCAIFGYRNNLYKRIIPLSDMSYYCDDIKIKANGFIEIKEENKITVYKYQKGKLQQVLVK